MIKLTHVRSYSIASNRIEVIWVNARHIVAVYATEDNDRPSVNATVLANGYTWAVEETPEMICSQIPAP